MAYAARITWSIGAAPNGGFYVNLIRIQDPTSREWIDELFGHGNPGIYAPASNASADLASTCGDPPIQPIGAWSKVGTVHGCSGFARSVLCRGQGLDGLPG